MVQGIPSPSSLLWGPNYPPSAFYFSVGFAFARAGGLADTSFQEVSGITSEIETEEVVEGGENRYVHQLPKGAKHPNLVLKRGIATSFSPLVTWCKDVLESDFSVPIVPTQMTVFLLNEYQIPIRAWSFANAYPVKWEVDAFNSTKNEVAIETIDFSYTFSNRLI